MASNKCLWFAVFCFFGVLCFLQIYSAVLQGWVNDGRELGLDDSHEQHVWWLDLLFFFLENTGNIPINGMVEETTQIRMSKNELRGGFVYA